MLDVHSEIQAILRDFIISALPCTNPRVTSRSAHAELAAPLAYACGLTAAECARLLSEANAARPPVFLGAPLLSSLSASGGYVCFSITAEAYSAAARHIIKSCPLPPLPDECKTEAEYALCRMLMLSRAPSGPLPDDRAIREAVWRAFCIPEAAPQSAPLRAAARLLLHMLDGKSARERAGLALGEIGGCAARLLARGIYGKPYTGG